MNKLFSTCIAMVIMFMLSPAMAQAMSKADYKVKMEEARQEYEEQKSKVENLRKHNRSRRLIEEAKEKRDKAHDDYMKYKEMAQ